MVDRVLPGVGRGRRVRVETLGGKRSVVGNEWGKGVSYGEGRGRRLSRYGEGVGGSSFVGGPVLGG